MSKQNTHVGVPFMVPASADGKLHYTLLFVHVSSLADLDFVKQELKSCIMDLSELLQSTADGRFYVTSEATEPWGRRSLKLLGDKIVTFHEKLFASMEDRLHARIESGAIKLGAYRLPHADVSKGSKDDLYSKFDVFDWLDLGRAERKLKPSNGSKRN
jgi:hypothetical protein